MPTWLITLIVASGTTSAAVLAIGCVRYWRRSMDELDRLAVSEFDRKPQDPQDEARLRKF